MRTTRTIAALGAVGLLAASAGMLAAPLAATATTVGAATLAAVTQGASQITLVTSAPTVWEGGGGTITATVKPVAPARGIATGSVDFYDDGFYFTSIPLGSTGKAKLPTNLLTAGVHTITADYTGDVNFTPSTTSTPLQQTVTANTPVAGATFTPSTVAPGATSRLVVSATNTGGTRLGYVGLGVLLPTGYRVVSMPPGQLCSARPGIYYCVTSVAVGGTAKLVLQVTGPVAPGAYPVNAYARNLDTGNETYATATLTVA